MPIIQRLGTASARGFGFGKIGAIYQEEITELSSGSDASTWQTIASGSIAETASGISQISTILTAQSQITESSTGSDDITSIPTISGQITESSSLIDATSTLANQNISVLESALSVDLINAIGVFNKQVSETSLISDANSFNNTYQASSNETALGADALSAAIRMSSVIIEIGIGEEEVNRLALANGIVNESAQSSDSINGAKSFTTQIAESSSASESVSNTLNYWIAIFAGNTTTGSLITHVYDLDIDEGGNIYITGIGNTGSIANAAIIAKYNNLGVLQWQRLLGIAGEEQLGRGITVDVMGNVYVAVTYNNNYIASIRKGSVVKYDSSGNLLYQTTYQPTGVSTVAYGLALDIGEENTYSVGSSGIDFLITKQNSSGVVQWMKTISSGYFSSFLTSVVDSSGNIFAAGYYGDTVSSSGYSYALLSQYDSSGNLQYQKRFTDTIAQRNTTFNSIDLDASQNIYCCGTATYNTGGSDYILLSKFDTSGTLLWSRGLYNANINSNPSGYCVAVDDAANMVYIVGSENGYISSGYSRIIVAKYNTSGVLQWQRFIGVTDQNLSDVNVRPSAISVDTGSSFYVTTQSQSYPSFSLILKLPKDGSLTGTYTIPGTFLAYYPVVYSVGNYTDTSLSFTVSDAPGSEGTPSISSGAGGATSYTSNIQTSTVYI